MRTLQFDFYSVRSLRIGTMFLGALAAATVGNLLMPLGGVVSAGEIILVDETFDGYTYFPDEKPAGDPVNFGVPLVGEGADSDLWMAARIEAFDNNPIYEDVGVQHIGGAGNNTPVGRMGDDAGLVLRLDLQGLTNLTLDFDWRTFLAETTDRLVVAYYVGDGMDFQPEGLGTPNNIYDWYNDPQLGGGVMDLDGGTSNSWYQNNWVELMRASESNSFTHEHFDVTLNDPTVQNSVVYVAFWMDNGNKDFGKIDNVQVMADYIPEPSSLILALVAAGMLGWFRRRR